MYLHPIHVACSFRLLRGAPGRKQEKHSSPHGLFRQGILSPVIISKVAATLHGPSWSDPRECRPGQDSEQEPRSGSWDYVERQRDFFGLERCG